MSIEAWVTDPAGTYLAHLERSETSPFRRFTVSLPRGADPGAGSLEHHLDNGLLREIPGLLDAGNLVWMRYRGKARVWIIEERSIVLDEGEHATDWVRVAGRGVKQLLADRLAFPPAFGEGTNLDPATWGQDSQWRRFTNRAAGEMLWDLIRESNGRFATQIARGTVETTGADGWTQDLRFDALLDIAGDVVAALGSEIDMDGLTFDYRTSPGIDRSGTVIFEEGADLLRVTRSASDRDTISWAVAEGVGEGVTAKLAVASDPTASRRREAYVDAKDAANVPLVQLRADAALAENTPLDSLALEVTEDRFEAFTDYDLHDTVRVIAPSRGIDESLRIVALYLEEADDERVRMGIDVNTPRQDWLERLDAGNRSTARSVSVRNRQPQGQLVPFSFSGQGVFDQDDTLEVHLFIPQRVYVTIEARVAIDIRPFFASAKSASSSGTLTSDSGGGSTSGASSSSTSDEENVHDHGFALVGSAGGFTVRRFAGRNGAGSSNDIDLPSQLNDAVWTTVGENHHHGIAHTHSTPNHQHTVAGHTHDLTYGVFKEAFPASHSVTLKVYELVAGAWTLRSTVAGLTADQVEVDLSETIDGPGQWMLELVSAAAQPNGGRLGAYVSGYVLGAIQSA